MEEKNIVEMSGYPDWVSSQMDKSKEWQPADNLNIWKVFTKVNKVQAKLKFIYMNNNVCEGILIPCKYLMLVHGRLHLYLLCVVTQN